MGRIVLDLSTAQAKKHKSGSLAGYLNSKPRRKKQQRKEELFKVREAE